MLYYWQLLIKIQKHGISEMTKFPSIEQLEMKIFVLFAIKYLLDLYRGYYTSGHFI